MSDENTIDDILLDFNQISSDRGVWESHWREIAERVSPALRDTFNADGTFNAGAIKNELVFDSSPIVALGRFTAIVTSLLTPDNSIWHDVGPDNEDLKKEREVKLYFGEVNRRLWNERRAPTANFSGQNIQIYHNMGLFGTGSIFIDSLQDRSGLRYKALPLGKTYYRENHQGQIDTMYRKDEYTARQLLQKWSTDVLPVDISETAKDPRKSNKKYDVIHCVKPNPDWDPSRLDFRGKKFISYYILKNPRALLEVGGYRTFPAPTARYSQAPGEVYGRSPAMEVLPAIKTLNEEKKTVLKQGHRTVDPVLLVHDDGVMDGFSMRPGALNSGGVSAEGRPLVHTLPIGNVAVGKDMMDDERAIINDAFLVNLFQILTENPQMTATEVLERTREKGILLAPTVGRQQSEYLGPMIERELDVLADLGKLPPTPQILIEAQGEYRIEYDNPMSRAVRADEAAGLQRTIQFALGVAQSTGDLSSLDHFNFDIIVPEMAEINAVPPRWLNDAAAIQATRQSRQQQQDQQDAIQAAPNAAALIKAQAAQQKVDQGE